MRILYLDTSSSFLYCGLVEDEKLIFDIKKHYEKDLSKSCLYEISCGFKKYSIKPDSIDKIIVVNGPGSFTGIRIGVDIAKTYGWALKIPVITVSGLNAMSLSIETKKDLIVPIIDARRGYVYGGVYSNTGESIVEDQYIKLSDFIDIVDDLKKDYVFVSNSSFDFDVVKYDPDILRIVNYFKDNDSIDIHLVNPVYLKSTEAEEKLKV